MALKKKNNPLKDTINNDLTNRDFDIKNQHNDNDDPGKYKVMTLRLPDNYKEKLQDHFKSKGMDLSNGLRMIIYEYMDKERIK